MFALALGLVAAIPVAGPILVAIAAVLGTVVGKILTNKPLALTIAGFLALGAADLHGRYVTNAKCTIRLADQVKTAAAAAKGRDNEIAAELAKKYEPQIVQLQSQSDSLKQQVSDYANALAKQPPAPQCELGSAASSLRVRERSRLK